MLSTDMVELCLTAALSPISYQQGPNIWQASGIVVHSSSSCAVNGLLCL